MTKNGEHYYFRITETSPFIEELNTKKGIIERKPHPDAITTLLLEVKVPNAVIIFLKRIGLSKVLDEETSQSTPEQ